MIDPRNLDTLLHPQFDAAALKAATPLGKHLEHLRELLVVRLYSQLTMLKHGLKEEKKSFLYVLRHLQKISQV